MRQGVYKENSDIKRNAGCLLQKTDSNIIILNWKMSKMIKEK